jgi:hypothetical protein
MVSFFQSSLTLGKIGKSGTKKVYNIGPCTTKLITAVIYRLFVPSKPFQPSPMFAGKAGAYPSEAPFRCRVGLTHKH